MAATDRDALLEEWDRLLGSGESLLTMFPKQQHKDWLLVLPDNVSDEMRWYATEVAYRDRRGREHYQNVMRRVSPDIVKVWITHGQAGLLGWRAIGALK